MANTYLTIEMITYEMLEVLHNSIVAAKKATRKYESQFARTGAKIGAMVQIRKPPLYKVTKAVTFEAQNYQELMVPLVVDQHDQIGVQFQNDDLALSMDDFSGRFVRPALVPMGNSVDIFILQTLMNQVWNATGTPGVIPAQDTPFLDAKTLLMENAASDDMLHMLVTNTTSARLSSGLAGRFNKASAISDLYDKGAMGPALGWGFYETQNMPSMTTGAWAASTPAIGIQVDGAGQAGASVLVKGAATTITGLGKKNDVVQFDGVYMVNPVTFLPTGLLQNFTLTADVDSTGGGAATLPISPSIILTGKNQTVTSSPADSAQLYVWGTATVANVASKVTKQNIGWQKEAVTLACVDLPIPGKNMGVDAVRASDPDSGLSVLFMRGFDIRDYSEISRLDMLYGATATRPEHVVRVAGAA